MHRGDGAARSGLPAKTIRYYEDIGLVLPLRGDNGYRRYRETDAQQLGFLRRARALGFSIEQCRALVALWADEGRASADVQAIARVHLGAVEAKIADLGAKRDTLAELVRHCAADESPDCAKLVGLARGRRGRMPPVEVIGQLRKMQRKRSIHMAVMVGRSCDCRMIAASAGA